MKIEEFEKILEAITDVRDVLQSDANIQIQRENAKIEAIGNFSYKLKSILFDIKEDLVEKE